MPAKAAMPGARCLRAAQLHRRRSCIGDQHCVVAHGPRKFRPLRTPTGGAPKKPFARLWAAQTKTIALAYGRRRLATSRSPTGGPTTWRSPTGGARQQHRARLRAAQAKGQRAYGHRSGRSERSDTSFMTGAGMPSGINIYIYIYIYIYIFFFNIYLYHIF